jgi:hypothetical protein
LSFQPPVQYVNAEALLAALTKQDFPCANVLGDAILAMEGTGADA